MTMQRRTTIDPRDILAIEYECRKCRSRYSVPLESASGTQMTCPNCGERWVKSEYSASSADPTNPAILQFVQSIQRLKSIGEEAIIRLEIAVPIEEIASGRIKS